MHFNQLSVYFRSTPSSIPYGIIAGISYSTVYFLRGAHVRTRQDYLEICCLCSTPEEINNILSNELSMTTAALKANPKVYWIWNHRRWCLENVPDGPERNETPSMEWRQANWDKELFVAEKMLDADARNCQSSHRSEVMFDAHLSVVHAWNYRRYILANMPTRRTETSELAYTSRKIGANFSNFSAWHQRSKSLVVLWESGQLDPVQSKDNGACAVSIGSLLRVLIFHRIRARKQCIIH